MVSSSLISGLARRAAHVRRGLREVRTQAGDGRLRGRRPQPQLQPPPALLRQRRHHPEAAAKRRLPGFDLGSVSHSILSLGHPAQLGHFECSVPLIYEVFLSSYY